MAAFLNITIDWSKTIESTGAMERGEGYFLALFLLGLLLFIPIAYSLR